MKEASNVAYGQRGIREERGKNKLDNLGMFDVAAGDRLKGSD